MNRKQLIETHQELTGIKDEAQNLNVAADRLVDKLAKFTEIVETRLAAPAESTSEVTAIANCIVALSKLQHYKAVVKMNDQNVVYTNFVPADLTGKALMADDVMHVMARLLKEAKERNV